MKFKFCYRCGQPAVSRFIENHTRSYCPSCDLVLYENPVPSVSLLIGNNKNQLLLVKRAVEPAAGLWSLPGGFVENGETTEAAAVRELSEETGLTVSSLKLAGVKDHLNGFYGDIILIAYEAAINYADNLKPGDDAEDAAFFNPAMLPPIAFKAHQDFIAEWRARHGL